MSIIPGSPNNDVLLGTSGDDTFIASSGNDSIDGAGGVNTLDYSSFGTSITVTFTSATSATIAKSNGADTASNIQYIVGTQGNDTFNGVSGIANTFIGLGGNNTFNGNALNDTANYSFDYLYGATHGIRANEQANAIQGGIPADTVINSFGGTDSIVNVRNITATAFNDIIYGGGHDNILTAGGGNDYINGGGGNDTIVGGGGYDVAGYSGQRSHYSITHNANGTVTITDMRGNSPDGIDTLSGVEVAQFADQSVSLRELARTDLEGNGASDMLLQSGGTIIDWVLQNGVAVAGNALGSGLAGWTASGAGDFNGDGVADVLLQNNGAGVDGMITNGAVSSGALLGVAAGFSVVCAGDFNGDGTTDVLLQSGGTIVDWLVANGVATGGNLLGAGLTGWTVVGTGDFNGDGVGDILLQNGGTIVAWNMSNGVVTSGSTVGYAPGWTVAGTGDFNGDGVTDVLLESGSVSSLTVVDWIVSNDVATSGNMLAQNLSGWSIAATGDYNGDGVADIALQSKDNVVAWTMSNGLSISGAVVGNAQSFLVRA